MGATEQFSIGAEAICTDGPCGRVIKVVVNPVARTVTHLIVEPKHRSGLGRLVPVDLVEATPAQVKVGCTTAEFERLPHAEETEFFPGGVGPYEDYDTDQVSAWPYYALGYGLVPEMGVGNAALPLVTDTVPVGDVTVRRGDSVRATDGEIGQVQGLVIDRASHHVTHVLLQEGHLWGRKEVAIPIAAVTGVDELGIAINMTKADVEDLSPVDINHPGS